MAPLTRTKKVTAAQGDVNNVKNTFIHLEAEDTDVDGFAMRTKSGTPLRADSDPVGRKSGSTRPFVTGILLERNGKDNYSTEEDYFSCDEDEDSGLPLERTLSFLPRKTSQHVKVRREDENGVDSPLLRTESKRPSLVRLESGKLKREPSLRVVREEDEVDTGPLLGSLERLSTYDPFTMTEHPSMNMKEDEVEAGPEFDTLERLSTYDPFNMMEPPRLDMTAIPGMPGYPRVGTDVSDADCDDEDNLERLMTYDPFTASSTLGAERAMPAQSPPPPMLVTAVGMMPVSMYNFVGAPYFAAQPPPCQQIFTPPAQGPPVGVVHSFHKEVAQFGTATPDFRQFTKTDEFEGRLSVLSSGTVHSGGVHKFLVQFTRGELTKPDGVGFIFCSKLPCTKNIQKIVSIFVNQSGQVCMRLLGYVVRGLGHIRALKIGDWIELTMDLDASVATFKIWPETPSSSVGPNSTVKVNFGKKYEKAVQKADPGPIDLSTGHFACVVQNVGVTATIGS